MSTLETLGYYSHSHERYLLPSSYIPALKFYTHDKRKILKVFLLSCIRQLLCELFQNNIQTDKTHSSMECYIMDSKIIQLLIQGIVETEEYTLEGIAHVTRIPFDVILDAVCGNNSQLSITVWAKIVDLYMQVKPEVAQLLFNKLIEIKDKHHFALSILLNEQ
jgi:hypothetical protein